MNKPTPSDAKPAEPAWQQLAIELGPLLVFFGANYQFGIIPATGAFMAAAVVALIASRTLLGKISPSNIM